MEERTIRVVSLPDSLWDAILIDGPNRGLTQDELIEKAVRFLLNHWTDAQADRRAWEDRERQLGN